MVGMDQDTPDTPADTPETDPTPNAADGAPVFDLTPEDRSWGMYAHLAALAQFILPFGNFLGPLVVWLMKKDTMPFVDDQGKEALNFQITISIAMIICIPLAFIVIGCVLLPIIYIGNLVLIIIASMAANRGETYRYPFAIRIIK